MYTRQERRYPINKQVRRSRVGSAPIGVLLSKISEDSIKRAFKGKVPLSLSYTTEDLKELRTIIKGIDPFSVDVCSRSVLRNVYRATEKSDPHEAFQRMHYDRWGEATKQAYDLMYGTSLEDLPLHINKNLTSFIVKWRLQINK